MKKLSKQRKISSLFLLCILSILIFALSGCSSSMSKYEKAYKDYETNFKQVILSEKNEKAYNQCMKELKDNIDNKKSSKCDDIMSNLDTLLDASKSYSESYLDKKQTEMDKKAETVNLYEAEESTVSDYKKQIKNCTSNEKYKDAADVYDKYDAFLSAIQNSGDYILEVSQVDVNDYPNVKLYVSIKDAYGDSIDDLEYKNFYISEDMNDSGFKTTKVEKAVQLDQEENLNIDIVADVSDSMNISMTSQGTDMEVSQEAMVNFVNQIQFNVGDKAGLMSFADGIKRNLYFTDDKNLLINEINNLQMGNMTSLYDALYASINQIATTKGAKCVIAFTDGEDTNSELRPEAVKDIAKRYKIPVYIIGIGSSLNSSVLMDITESTGGFYEHIADASYMSGIYERIFKEQKSQYLVEYKTSELSEESITRNLYIRYMSNQFMTRNICSYQPQELLEASKGGSGFNQDDYIFIDSDSRYLTIADLEKLTAEQLRIARNEIYARRGRKFADSELQRYFNGFSWYNGTIEPEDFNGDNMFNKYEYTNVKFIKQYEDKLR